MIDTLNQILHRTHLSARHITSPAAATHASTSNNLDFLFTWPTFPVTVRVIVTELHSWTMFSEESCSVGLSEKMGFQLRSELLATVVRWTEVWWKCVPDDRSCDKRNFTGRWMCLPMKRTGSGQSNGVTDVTSPRLGRWLAWGRQDQYLGHSQRSKQQSWTVSCSDWQKVKNVAE